MKKLWSFVGIIFCFGACATNPVNVKDAPDYVQITGRYASPNTERNISNPEAVREGDPLTPSSIDMLSPNNKSLQTLAELPISSAVVYHSIIGDLEGGDAGTDGIVDYWSSHLDGAETEVVLKGGHYINRYPEAIREVRRILHDHLAER